MLAAWAPWSCLTAFGCSRRALILPLAVTLTVGTAAAQNENFLDQMFIGPQRQHQDVRQQATPFANPRYADRHEGQRRLSTPSSSGGGARVAYCVRLCDGRYFPIQRSANAVSYTHLTLPTILRV